MHNASILRIAITLVVALTATARADWRHLGPVQSWQVQDAAVELYCGDATVRIEASREHVVRLRLAPIGRFAHDFSWAVTDLKPREKVELVRNDERHVEFAASALRVVVQKTPCRLKITDAAGHVLIEDESDRGMAWRTGPEPGTFTTRVWQKLPVDAAVYGLGEKTGPLNKAGQAWTMWNTDAWAYGPSRDPLYMSIPFFIVADGAAFHGVFLDNPWRTSFDFGKEDRGVLSFGAEGGELNYYIIAGPGPKEVVERYTDLTGRIELPPLWSLGYHQCRYSYAPESRVREIAREFVDRRIPCDVLYFDIDYMDGFRCFTWDRRRFPDPKKLTGDLKSMGFHTVAIIDPAIKKEPGYFAFDSGSRIDAWLKRPDSQPYVSRVWAGSSVFPDFTNAGVRKWWTGLFPPFVAACGVDGIWNDMNEPADFDGPDHTVPLDLLHDNNGRPASHRACHNVYGMQGHRAAHDGLQLAHPGERVFTMTRATYAGGQRFGAAWTGDNASTWEHLRMSIAMNLGLGISGMPFTGPDIGGFAFGATPELYARWIEVGSLFPYCRTHTSWNNPDQEPWSFGPQVEAIAKRSLERRYECMPYLYTLFEEAERTGVPIMRPVWMEFPTYREGKDQTFMWGPNIFVAPILQPDSRERWIELPPGVWYDADTGDIHAAGQPIRLSPELDRLPMFIRAGAVIPRQTAVRNTQERPAEPLVLDVWPNPGGDLSGTLYEDDGRSLEYQRGQFRRTTFSGRHRANEIDLAMSSQGRYQPPSRRPLIRLHGVRGEALSAKASRDDRDQSCESRYDDAAKVWLIRLPEDDGRNATVHIEWRRPAPKPEPVRLTFAEPKLDIPYLREMTWDRGGGKGAALVVRNDFGPHFVLRRLQVPGEALPVLHFRMSTQNARSAMLHFATEEDPTLSDRTAIKILLTPDGELQDYVVDMGKAAAEQWRGTIYYLRIDLQDGVRADEVVRLGEIAFEAR